MKPLRDSQSSFDSRDRRLPNSHRLSDVYLAFAGSESLKNQRNLIVLNSRRVATAAARHAAFLGCVLNVFSGRALPQMRWLAAWAVELGARRIVHVARMHEDSASHWLQGRASRRKTRECVGLNLPSISQLEDAVVALVVACAEPHSAAVRICRANLSPKSLLRRFSLHGGNYFIPVFTT